RRRDYDRGRRERFSPPRHISPQHKRMRRDCVDETEAVKRYNQYKLDFRRQQLQDFFLQHKEQEWFRSKYHPDNITTRKAESLAALKTRLGVFLFLMDNNWLDNVSLDMDHCPAIIKLLDAAVIKMEGGTDFDLQVLEDCEEEAKQNGEKEKDEEGEEGEEEEEEEEGEEKKDDEEEEEGEEKTTKKKGRKRKRSVSADSGEGSASDSDSSHSDGDKEEDDEKEEEEEDRADERRKERGKEREKEAPAKPRPLHLTTSLFIRSIPPEVSKEEITALCRRYPGFLRVALSDPQPERRFFRRCWVTFDRGVNIKETCWNLQNIRLRDCELSPVVNRDLCRRVRNVNGLTHHKPVLRNDIRLSARLVHSLDQRGELWAGQMETNPVLKNITDYLIEEVSAEEEELTGAAGGNADGGGDAKDPASSSSDVTVETDDKLMKVLDRLLLYLRLVHSVDYYNFCEYPAEDEMPHRCGLIHVRGPLPVAKITARLSPLLSPSETLSEDDAARLGKKEPEQEVEKFLSANAQELSKDKWLCPLSGKKFKAPEFVRKHILNKHGEKVTAVRQEVEFFNNFLLDAKRPALPENKPLLPLVQATHPGVPGFPGQAPQQQSLLGYPPGVRPPMPGFPGGGPPYPPNQFGVGRGNYDNFRGHLGGGGGGGGVFPGKQRNNRGVRGDPRSIIEYRDLDAPDDLDFF
uniref:Serrate RNA effector molecule-like n=1 Tax=Scophthalmus maximus TaxID=52904 RepID=A0A8D3B7G4_SCOMX